MLGPVFDAVDTTTLCVALMRRMLADAVFRADRMEASMRGDFSTATDLADALAADGVPFREAHEIVGRVVRDCLAQGIGLEDLALADLRRFDARFTERALEAVLPRASANARTSEGGTSTSSVAVQIGRAREVLATP